VQSADLPAPSDEKLASPLESAVTTSTEEEEHGPFLINEAQVRAAKITWPDVDLIDKPGPSAILRWLGRLFRKKNSGPF
jgi:hypothetical protein